MSDLLISRLDPADDDDDDWCFMATFVHKGGLNELSDLQS